MRVVPYILYLYLLALHCTILSDITGIFGAIINLAVLMVTMVALYKTELVSFWFAISVGIVVGTLRLDLMPVEIFLFAGAALMVHQISVRINLESITSRLLILVGFLLIHDIVITLVISPGEFIFLFYRMILPSTLYSLIIGWLFFRFLDGHITWRKVKTLF